MPSCSEAYPAAPQPSSLLFVFQQLLLSPSDYLAFMTQRLSPLSVLQSLYIVSSDSITARFHPTQALRRLTDVMDEASLLAR